MSGVHGGRGPAPGTTTRRAGPLLAPAPPVPTPPEDAAAYRRHGWWPTQHLRAGVEAVAGAEPGRWAIADEEGICTYGELRRRIERSIGALVGAGLRPGDPVLLVAPNHRASVSAFAAILRASGVVVALDRRAGAADVAQAVAATAPRVIVAPDALRTTLHLDAVGVPVLALATLHVGRQPVDDWAEPDWLAPRIVLFTSGTTSRPKAVVHHLHSFSAGVANLGQAFGFGEADAPFLCSPLASITGLSQVQLALGGGHIVLEDDFQPARSVDRLEHHRATLLGGAPVITELLFAEYQRRGTGATSLRTIALGGSMIPPAVVTTAVQRFGIRAIRVYGSSEAPTHTASGTGDEPGGIPVDEGVPLRGGAVRIGSPAAPDEVLVKGPNLFQGYLEREDNEGAFVDGWFSTGDLGEMDDGRLTVRGRLKEVVVRKGVKISLAEIDEVLRDLPGTLEGAAFGLPDDDTGERLAVALHVRPEAAVTYDDVCAHLRRIGLATGKLPEQVDLWADPLPRTPSGKIQRRALASPPPGVRSDVAPRLRRAAGHTGDPGPGADR